MDLPWAGIGFLVLLAAIVLWAIKIYNRLVKRRQRVAEAWSGIDVQLKRRTNLIPNLIETVKGYMGHERETLEAVIAMRSRAQGAGNVEDRAKAEGQLSGALMNLFAVAEDYPELRANESFATLQSELADLEYEIQMARRYYNGSVRDLNILIESFPSALIAGRFKFAMAQYFEIEDPADRAVPKVDFGTG
ncbi:MAG: LemA family protein [Rhodospirillaceae bacterium]|nr:LemA family protein [Rhodospirillaceae bacterium]